ncbi:MAG TPA: hypothetical protein VFW69_17355 [Mycobacterium sp.]|nr:hypothetical protein [Mycobacterium sp.]
MTSGDHEIQRIIEQALARLGPAEMQALARLALDGVTPMDALLAQAAVAPKAASRGPGDPAGAGRPGRYEAAGVAAARARIGSDA